ncbi:MAG TPA: universal stress protein [Nitrosopumilaceae archaeon]|nr:universal stress protein [Nitrosopumilaceae archaeon]
MSSDILSRILVPYDGSKYSKMALSRAIEIAKKDKSKIDIVSVINIDYIRPPGALLGMVSPSSINAIKRITASAKKETAQMLATQVSKCRAKGIKADSQVLSGYTVDAILKYAKQKKTTLIVLGSQGLHGIKKLKILGSTSRKVSELANCPVLIVR